VKCGGEALTGVVVAGGLVRSHRERALLLELVEAAPDDVAAPVPLPLLATEVDRAKSIGRRRSGGVDRAASIGRPGRLRRWAIRSSRSGIVVAMPRLPSHARFTLGG
jgi:hypothetical protein